MPDSFESVFNGTIGRPYLLACEALLSIAPLERLSIGTMLEELKLKVTQYYDGVRISWVEDINGKNILPDEESILAVGIQYREHLWEAQELLEGRLFSYPRLSTLWELENILSPDFGNI
jgi:hypothetical protein